MDIVFMVDQSESMSGGGKEKATDPGQLRLAAVRYAINDLRLKSTPEHSHRVGLVQFGSDAPENLAHALVPVSDAAAVRGLEARLRPLNLVWTNFSAGLQRAQRILDAGGAFAPNHRPAVVIFTDGSPQDPRRLERSQYFAEIRRVIQETLSSRQCTVYVVALDAANQYWPSDRVFWEQATERHAFGITSIGDLGEQFNDVLRDILQLPKLPKDLAKPGTTPFTVGPYLDQVEFHILGGDSQHVRILDSQGHRAPLQEWRSQDYSILVATHPGPGRWRYEVRNRTAPLTIYRNEVPVRPQLILPRPEHPRGKPVRLLAKVCYGDGQELRELRDFPLRVTARVADGQGEPRHLTLAALGDGTYTTSTPVSVGSGPGSASVDVVLHAGTTREYLSTNTIHRNDEPYFDVTLQAGSALRHYSDFINVTARLLRDGRPISSGSAFTSPTAVIRAQLTKSPKGERSGSVWLDPSPSDPSTYVASVPASVRQAGAYVVTCEVGGSDARSGHRVAYSEPITLTVTPTWIDRAIVGGETVAILLLAAAALLCIWLAGAVVWAVRLPRMRGGTLVVTVERPMKASRGSQPHTPSQALRGLSDLASSSEPSSASTQTPPPGRQASTHQLTGRFVAIRPGRFLFVHEVACQPEKQRVPLGQDRSRRTFIVRYLVGKVKCQSGSEVVIGRHRLLFK